MKIIYSVLFFLFVHQLTNAQIADDIMRRIPGQGGFSNKGSVSQSQRKDSAALGFEHRDDSKDSIGITFKVLDSVRNGRLDSVINDFDRYFSVPSTFANLGNNGAAANALIFTPNTKAGWDAGFHAYDIYKFKIEETRFFKTNRPYTQLGYQLASGKEQMIKVFHTQNPRPNWNFGLDYKLISAPGFFNNQNANHKSYRLFSNYQGKRKRYAMYIVFQGNKIRSAENGGIVNDSLLSDPNKKERFSIDVNLGNGNKGNFNPFNTTVNTGNIYKDFTFFLRQTYDLGKKDSVAINDSTTDYLFYPKLRLQHTFSYKTDSYLFTDYKTNLANYTVADFKADSLLYKNWYNINFSKPSDTIILKDKWTIVSNDFSLIQFPDTKNQAQFFLAGAKLENIKGEFATATKNYYNILVHGEYRNKTRNRLWDVLLKGEFYVNGLNAGDYAAQAYINRFLNKKWGDVKLFFINTNRTPSFIFNGLSSFNLGNSSITKKENIISFGAIAANQFITLSFKNHLLTNYTYFTNYYHTAQSSKVINLVQMSASKKFRLFKKWNWYADITAQQTDGASPIKVPFIFTRNRIAFEGVFYKNLNLSTGLEVRYYTPYKAYNYSPVMGQFMPQDTVTIKNLPDVAAFMHFRIKSFTAFIRTENLNAISFKNGFGFINNNFAAPHYPTQGFMFRLGIQWGFVN
ncbi:MAG: hypothetical protein IPP48_12610 [Chitinophagaceae bacterium]|nr:hypothetical protein [Chitinophagaceae bacterium]